MKNRVDIMTDGVVAIVTPKTDAVILAKNKIKYKE